MTSPLRIQEPFRAAFYIPFYVALAQRRLEAAGVEVELVPGTEARGGGEQVLAAVTSGAVDVGWGGPIRVLAEHDRDPASTLRCFGAAVLADPFFIVGRRPRPGFRLADLLEVTLGIVAEVPTPWWILAHDLRQAGVDSSRLTMMRTRGMAENAQALADGQIEAAQLPEPFVSRLVRAGIGHVWDVAASRGPTAYSSFYATLDQISGRRDALGALSQALDVALAWLGSATSGDVARLVAPFYPELEPRVLEDIVLRYQAARIWPTDGEITEAAFTRLREAMLGARAIRSTPPLSACVIRWDALSAPGA